MKRLTEREKKIVEAIGHPLYTVKNMEEWLNVKEDEFEGIQVGLRVQRVKGFYDAVQALDTAEARQRLERIEKAE